MPRTNSATWRVLNGLLERLEESFQKAAAIHVGCHHTNCLLWLPFVAWVKSDFNERIVRKTTEDIIGSMLEEVARLTSMIDTLLTISQADSGTIRLNRTVFPVMELVRSQWRWSVFSPKKQNILVIGEGAPLVSADRGFLRMAVINLLDNAVKYSPPSTAIHVELHLVKGEAPNSRQVNLAVKMKVREFHPRGRAKCSIASIGLMNQRARETGGAGLGLAIAKWSVEAHGGTIVLDSHPGSGSEFSIRLPLA